MSKANKQAVLLIHGIGEQRPMETLRGFVDTVWVHDAGQRGEGVAGRVWSKPDPVSNSFELRRLTTNANLHGVRTDFYEYYWAHLMEGTATHHVTSWVRVLVCRWPWRVPARLFWPWLALVSLTVAVLVLGAAAIHPALFPKGVIEDLDRARAVYALIAAGLALSAGPLLKNYIGDAARYLTPSPENVSRRQEIRAKGVELLERLHAEGYGRIVVVGHSLGSVIGYDLLTHAWARLNDGKGVESNAALAALEGLPPESSPELVRAAQRALHESLVAQDHPWRVTDFVTMGSPLAHAEVLLARDRAELLHKQVSREYLTCPPQRDEGDGLTYSPDGGRTQELHHAAAFAVTRWTNLYFPAGILLWGDVIAGPLVAGFGAGIRDVAVRTRQWWGFLAHTHYWDGQGEHVAALRDAVDLLDRDRPRAATTIEAPAGPEAGAEPDAPTAA